MVSRLKVNSKTNNKSSFNYDNITIDAKHNEMIQYFQNLKDSIPLLREELKKMIAEYNNKDPTRKSDLDYIVYRDNLREKINELKDKINKILNNEELNNYYLEVGCLLHNYYENIESSKNTKQDIVDEFEENLINNMENEFDNEYDKKKEMKSVIHFFNKRDEEKTPKDVFIPKEITRNNAANTGYTSMKISDFVKEEQTFKKKDILEKYLQKIDPNFVSKIKIDNEICKCSNCNNEMTLFPSDGIQICEGCGIQQNIFIESDKPSFKDPPMEVCYFSYRRINHFNEFGEMEYYLLYIYCIYFYKKNDSFLTLYLIL